MGVAQASAPHAPQPAPVSHADAPIARTILQPPSKTAVLSAPDHGPALLTQTISTLASDSAVAAVVYSSAWQPQTVTLMAETAAMHVNPSLHATHT